MALYFATTFRDMHEYFMWQNILHNEIYVQYSNIDHDSPLAGQYGEKRTLLKD